MLRKIKFCILGCLLFVVIREVLAVKKIKGYVDDHINITCSHLWASTNIKYLCRWQCKDGDILIKSEGVKKTARNKRYSLYDSGNGQFTVTIAGLWVSDSGTYWCGVERSGLDTFQEVVLEVLNPPQMTKPLQAPTLTSVTSGQGSSSNKNPNVITSTKGYLLASLCTLLSIVVLSLTLCYIWNKKISSFLVYFSNNSHELTRGRRREKTKSDNEYNSLEQLNSDRKSPVYQNIEPGIIQSNPVYQMLQTNSVQLDQVYDSLVLNNSQNQK